MKKNISILLLIFFVSVEAQVSGSLMQHPDVSDTQICFIYGNDVWIASKSGGSASRLSSPDGPESYPRFSPDGKSIAFTANYQGNSDVYVISVKGGVPKRLTYHGMSDRVLGWTPNGKSVLFASSRESGRQRYSQFYTIPTSGGQPTKLEVPYGEYGSFSGDAKKIAYTDMSRVNRNWKRYRGGTAPDIHVFDLTTFKTSNITNNNANDELPMWVDNNIFYMSDNGLNKRNNLWKYDINTKRNSQLTNFTDFDITFPENSSKEIIFEAGGKLYIYTISTGETNEVSLNLISDEKGLIPKHKNVASYLHSYTISPDAKRVVAEARGELFNLPASEGFISNLTNSSGYAERSPAWSPDGNSLAYWSDKNGEYQLTIMDMSGNEPPKTITNLEKGYNYTMFWSPDSKKIAYINQAMQINYIDVASGKVKNVDKGKYMLHYNLSGFKASWSPDSKWFTYARGTDNSLTSAIFVYSLAKDKVLQLTSGFYTDSSPVFSADGKHLFYITNRALNPVYSDLDNSFIYPNSSSIAVGTLDPSTASLMHIENDEFEPELKNSDKDSKEEKSDDDDSDEEITETSIEAENFETRVEILNVAAGNISDLSAVEGKLLFSRRPNLGSSSASSPSVDYYDFEDMETKTIIEGLSSYMVSGNAKKLIVSQSSKLGIIDIAENQKMEEIVPTSDMAMEVIPKEEWKQIFMDVWRFERDFFYDPAMHGVDWDLMKERYGKLIDQANSRNDVNIIIGDLIGELNASHAYVSSGDTDSANRLNVGYLGADFTIEDGKYRIKNIIKGAAWDVDTRSPLLKPGLDVDEGDYILSINGIELDTNKPIYAALQGLAGETVQLVVNSKPTFTNARKIIVKPLGSETRLRHLAWIENNRKMVDEATDGRVGYVYVRSTGYDGQNELIRQYYGQFNKEAFIIDERFNSGGQIPDRFVEILDRKPLAFFATRDGKPMTYPQGGNFGPKVMLINGFSGSGGDAFPDYFRKRELGPLIGTRTWGGLIGISGGPTLIDNGRITLPTFRMYGPDGEWFKEGYGVDPDIEVKEDFEQLAKGNDAQIEAGIKEIMKLLETSTGKIPGTPKYEKR